MVTQKRTVTVEGTFCDICDDIIHFERFRKCIVCGKDVCEKCNPIEDFNWRATKITLCPEHFNGLLLSEFVGKLRVE